MHSLFHHSQRLTALFLLLALMLTSASLNSLAAADRVGDYQSGPLVSDDGDVYVFAFRIRSSFDEVGDKTWKAVQALVADRKNAKTGTMGIGRIDRKPTGKTSLTPGELLVVGYYNKGKNHWGWMAANSSKAISGRGKVLQAPYIRLEAASDYQPYTFEITFGGNSVNWYIEYGD